MADPISAGVAMGTNLATSGIVEVVKACRIAARCKSECGKLADKLESIEPDVEDILHPVEGFLKLEPNTKQTDMRIVARWLQKFRAELRDSSAAVDQCSKIGFCRGVNQYSLSKKISAHIMKIEKLEDQLPNLSVSLQILCNLVTGRRSQVEFPEVFTKWVKEKNDILRRADVTKRYEAASCSAAQVHSIHGNLAIYKEDAIQHSYPCINQPRPLFNVSSPQVNPPGSQFPVMTHLGSQFPPSPFMSYPSSQVHPSYNHR